ncbi:MAG TPA: AAA domain-containing protein, partial [Thermodesulfovibrionia bacterium]|nr:AAA domain-containing protein [Thermodesulfovibrionia bacterium]
TADPEMIANLSQGLLTVVEPLQEGPSGKWKLSVIFAGRQGGKEKKIWDKLVEIIASVCADAASASELLVKFGPSLPADQSLEDSILILDDIISHLSSGGSLNFFTLLTRSYWRQFLAAAKINNRKPSHLEHFQALKVHALLQKSRNELLSRWDRMFVPLGGPKSSELGNRPEISCRQFTQTIVNCLDWHNKNWKPVEEELVEIGFCLERFIHEEAPNLNPCGELLRLRDAINKMPDILASRANQVRLFQIERTFASLLRKIESAGDGAASAHVVRALKESVKHKNTAEYRIAFERLVDLHNRSTDLTLRYNLLKRLEPVAPGWAADVRDRIPPHDKRDMLGEPQKAWLWRQLNEELQIRSAKSVNEMQNEIASLTEELKRTTGRLIAHRAWANQVRKINKDINKRMALKGWQQTVRAMGARTGKRVPQLLKKARELMNQSQSAVPVWIMPLSRVVENFDPKTSRFDVVIIDEASQSDLMGFAALYLGKQVVVVGDHEQVSPLAAGQSIENVDNLINLHLSGIPLNHLYVPTTSLYDMAKTSFGGMICLREHFRCVPEIIQFSNALSYNWQIKPLRDSSLVQLKPATIAYRVESASSDDKVNETEAQTVASLLIAAIEQSEYSGKTFGVISLVGEDQALEIEKILRTHLTPTVIESRRIVCGNSAQFQGDERDVMFLSVVDGPKEGPLVLRQAGSNDMFKKRFNVAASRAKDQMWVVHSLNVEIDLKPGDLRRRLIEHAMNPSGLMEQLQQGERQTESEFERLVHRWLVTEGYKLIPQWRVGHYRIDLVVKGKSRLLAVECDGDRFHPAEKLADDMARQAILERLGWTFVRIRGSEFFRNQEKAMQPVFAKLRDMGIEPSGLVIEEDNIGEQSGELKERVIRRAAEIRSEWEQGHEAGL